MKIALIILFLNKIVSTESFTSVVSGASRGIGLEFSKQLLKRNDNNIVISLIRSVNNNVIDLQNNHPNRYFPIEIDLHNQETLDKMANQLKNLVDNDLRVDLLINTAGILGGNPGDLGPERSIDNIDREWLTKSLETNLIGHVMVTKLCIPYMKKAFVSKEMPSKIVNISARVGSISDNYLGGWYSYRMSKAALNMFTKTSSIELKRHNILTLSMHPGTTDTDLSKPFQKNVKPDKLLTVSSSVSQMLTVIDSCNDINNTGSFLSYDGTKIEW